MKDFFEYRESLTEAKKRKNDLTIEPEIPEAEKKKLIKSVYALFEDDPDLEMEFPEDFESEFGGKARYISVPGDLRNTSLELTQFPKALVVYAYEDGGSNPSYSEGALVFEKYKLPGGKKGDEIKRWLFWACADMGNANPFRDRLG